MAYLSLASSVTIISENRRQENELKTDKYGKQNQYVILIKITVDGKYHIS